MLIKNSYKYFLVLLGLVFALSLFFYSSNKVEALTCTYSPAQTPSQYYCYDSGTCAITDDSNVACSTGQWINCREVMSDDGSSQRLCWCSGTCTVVGRTVSGSACGSSNTCSYNFGNNCNVPGASGGTCSRVMTYPSSGDGDGGGGSITTETCPSGIFDISRSGGASMTVYAGDSTALGYNISAGPAKSMVNIATEVVGCPNGANCSAKQVRTVYSSDGAMYGAVTVSPVSTAPGTYTVSVKAYENENPDCIRVVDYSVTVKPSRKMVCDGGWYEVPPGSIPYNTVNSGPVVLYNNGASNFEKYFKASYNGQWITSMTPLTYGNQNFSLNCRYNNGLSDTCTWDQPVQMPYDTAYGWPSNSGTMGTTASAVDSNTPNNRTVTLRRNGNRFEYSCTNNSPISPVCDNSWRYLPQGGATPSQPVGVFVGASLDSQYRDSVAIGVRGSGGASTGAYVTSCKFNGTNTCTWDSSWASLGAVTSYPLNMSLGWSLDLNLKTTWAGGEWVKNINRNSGWSGWVNQGADNNISWGQPFRTQDKLGRYWQFRSINGSVAYACGATPVCVTLNYDSTKSSISKTNLASGEAFTVKCDYGVRGIDAVGVTTGGGATCAFSSWDNGNTSRTTANFNCTAGNVGGTFPVSCTNVAGTPSNVCAQSNSLGNITVTAPPSATADISANPTTIPYNSASTISWTSTNATSCSIDPTGWTGTSGNRSTGNLVSSRTYSVSCLPAGMNSTDSVTVNVQAPNQYILNVVRSGQGTVTSNPTGINCGSDCSESFAQDTNVVLTATPASGRIFTGWTVQGGGSCPGTGTCTVTMTSGKTVTANFALNPNFIEF